jgi:peptidoglycan/LPS O-acetylase OafA/YrhL
MQICQNTDKHGITILKQMPACLWIAADIALYSVVRLIPESNMFLSLLVTGLNELLNIVGALMSFVVLSNLSQIAAWENNKVFFHLSKYSFSIYLLHQQLVFCGIYWLNGRVNPYINALLNILFAFAGSLFISWSLMRYKTTRVLIGEKA